jgi:hypothetical protein
MQGIARIDELHLVSQALPVIYFSQKLKLMLDRTVVIVIINTEFFSHIIFVFVNFVTKHSKYYRKVR